MRLNVRHLNIRSIHQLDAWVERQIFALGVTQQIDEANIRLVRVLDSSPGYEVSAHLVTPGPDVFAESRDHTLRAAFTKVMAQLRDQIGRRASKRLRRRKSQQSAPTAKARSTRFLRI
jgi:ribosome-associated translation inhibitor RaiA